MAKFASNIAQNARKFSVELLDAKALPETTNIILVEIDITKLKIKIQRLCSNFKIHPNTTIDMGSLLLMFPFVISL